MGYNGVLGLPLDTGIAYPVHFGFKLELKASNQRKTSDNMNYIDICQLYNHVCKK